MKKRLFGIILSLVLISIFSIPAFADVPAVSQSSFLKTTVSVTVTPDVMAEYAPTNVRVYLKCTAGKVVKPGTAECPKVGYFAYLAPQTSKTATGTVFSTTISKTNSLPAAGWMAEITKTATVNKKSNTYTNAVSISSMLNDPTVTLSASTGKGSLGGFRLFPSLVCEDQALTCLTEEVFKWSQAAIIVLAVGAIVVAGIVYMTSAGNPKRIETAKKLIFGALTGIAVMVLGRLFLTKVVGVSWPW